MRNAHWTRERRLTSKQRSLSPGKIKHHASVDNTRMMRRFTEQSCAPHNALRAGTSRALQVRARATVLPGLVSERCTKPVITNHSLRIEASSRAIVEDVATRLNIFYYSPIAVDYLKKLFSLCATSGTRHCFLRPSTSRLSSARVQIGST